MPGRRHDFAEIRK